MTSTTPWMPPGSDVIAQWAYAQRLAYVARPDESWFRAWEPHDTMVSPELWLNSVTRQGSTGVIVIAEAWTAGEACEPIERTLVAFAELGGLRRRAAMRTGEPFLTKVAFLEQAPPPRVTLGDAAWDAHVTTFAASAAEAEVAFPRRLRELLRARGFRGHLEVRPRGFVVHHEGVEPTPQGYDLTLRVARDVASALLGRP